VLDTQVFKKDELSAEEFTWREKHLKPGFHRPVIVHRAILGSVERFMAILIEHLAGKFPFWMSPRQCIVVPISEKSFVYAESVYKYLHKLGYECDWDRSNGQLNKKIRNAQLAQWNYILVCGEEEAAGGFVDVRTRDNTRHGKMRVDELAKRLATEKPDQSKQFSDFYANAWNPDTPATEWIKEEKKEDETAEVKAPVEGEESASAEVKAVAKPKKEKYVKPQAQATPAAPLMAEEWETFVKCDLRVGKITACEVHPESDKLYNEKVTIGDAEDRCIGSGL